MIGVVVTTGAISHAKAIVKSSPPTNQHSVFLQAGCPSCCLTNSIRALKGECDDLWLVLYKLHFVLYCTCDGCLQHYDIRCLLAVKKAPSMYRISLEQSLKVFQPTL